MINTNTETHREGNAATEQALCNSYTSSRQLPKESVPGSRRVGVTPVVLTALHFCEGNMQYLKHIQSQSNNPYIKKYS